MSMLGGLFSHHWSINSVKKRALMVVRTEIQWDQTISGVKVQTLWEGHKIWKNLPPVLTKQFLFLSSVKTNGTFSLNFCGLFRKAELYWVNPTFIQFLWTLWFQVKRSHERIHILQLIFEMVVDRQVPSHMWKGQATKYHNIIKRGL